MTEQQAADLRAQLAKLREPFAPANIAHLPKVWCKSCREASSKVCDRHRQRKCQHCGNNITEAHADLDYVGHAEVTSRLLEVDPLWTWEPLALDDKGLPLFDEYKGLWMRLTICGISRIGYGTAAWPKYKDPGDIVKEIIGDCLVTGTPIVTDRGVIPIQDVRVGDLVPTRQGWKRVTDHWLSEPDAPVVAVALDDGTFLVGTPHHRVPTVNRGVQPLCALRNGDTLYAWQDTENSPTAKRSSGRDVATGASPAIRRDTAGPTSWPRPHHAPICTVMSMSATSAPSQTAGMSTISTLTPSTTTPAISPRSARKIMSLTMRNCRKGPNSSNAPAIDADASTALTGAGRAGARQPASKRTGVKPESPTSVHVKDHGESSEPATIAAPLTSRIDPQRASVQRSVVAVLDAGTAEVWNLSVEDVHEYVAQGVFVHNSIRNAAQRFGVALDLWAKTDLNVDRAQLAADTLSEAFSTPMEQPNEKAAVQYLDADGRERVDVLAQRIGLKGKSEAMYVASILIGRPVGSLAEVHADEGADLLAELDEVGDADRSLEELARRLAEHAQPSSDEALVKRLRNQLQTASAQPVLRAVVENVRDELERFHLPWADYMGLMAVAQKRLSELKGSA